MEEGGSYVVQMPKKGEEAAPQLVVPHLVKNTDILHPHFVPLQYINNI